VRPYSKNKLKRAGEVDQVVECLPTKYKALSSNSSAAKEEKKERGVGLE
jgi:predicted ATPase